MAWWIGRSVEWSILHRRCQIPGVTNRAHTVRLVTESAGLRGRRAQACGTVPGEAHRCRQILRDDGAGEPSAAAQDRDPAEAVPVRAGGVDEREAAAINAPASRGQTARLRAVIKAAAGRAAASSFAKGSCISDEIERILQSINRFCIAEPGAWSLESRAGTCSSRVWRDLRIFPHMISLAVRLHVISRRVLLECGLGA
eukprot:1094068-Rhodomonas_salina.1